MTEFLALCARLAGNELVAGECENLTGGKPEADGVAFCRSVELVSRGAYVHTGLRLIARAESLPNLLQVVKDLDFQADNFRIEYTCLARQKQVNSRQAAIDLANVIEAYPDLDNPRHRFLIVEREHELCFGEILAEADRSYRQHDAKPYRTSASLPSQVARALVNLVSPPAQSILDPCCGTGSILLEAQALGLEACGIDWNPRMVGISRKNLSFFGYASEIILADYREVWRKAEAVIADLPYGRFMHEDQQDIQEIILHTLTMAPMAVFVLGEDLSPWLREVGYREVEVFQVRKHKDFSRFVHRARSGVYS
jgi:tRNA G10  N-methylase Trm11